MKLRSEFAQQTTFAYFCRYASNISKSHCGEGVKVNKGKLFLHFYAFEHLVRINRPELSMV